MTAISWKNAVNGDWATAADWSGGVVPKGTDDVSINLVGAYDVKVATSAEAAHTVTLNAANGSLEISNTLTMGSSLTVTNGELLLDSAGVLSDGTTGSLVVNGGTFALAGTIKGGSVKIAGGTFDADGGTLNATTVLGPLDLDTIGANLVVSGGLTATGAGGTGTGSIDITGGGAVLRFGPGVQTLDNTVITIGGSVGDSINLVGASGTLSTLTFGTADSINQVGALATIDNSSTSAADSIINKGVIRATFNGGTLFLAGGAITNQGAINVNVGDTLNDSSSNFTNSANISVIGASDAVIGGGTFTNSGTFNISAGSAVTIDPGSFANTGTINVSTNGTLDLSRAPTGSGTITDADSTIALLGAVTVPEINMITSRAGGEVYLEGTLNNTAGTLNVGTGTGVGQVDLTGTIIGGIIHDAGLGMEFTPAPDVSSTAVLQGVTYEGALDLSETSASLEVTGGIKVTGTGGTGPGVINLTGSQGRLTLDGSQTLDNATIRLARSTIGVVNNGTTTAVTFGANLTIVTSVAGGGGNTYIDGSSATGDSLTNKGTILDDSGDGSFTINTGALFTNQGTFIVSNNAAATVSGSTFANSGVISITTLGAMTIGSGYYYSYIGTMTNSGSITLSGESALDIGANTLTNSGTITVGAGSNLTIENGNWLNTGAGKLISNNGSVHLGGTITQATLKQVTRTGGELEIRGLLNNAGTLNVGSGQTFGILTLSGTIADGVIHDTGGGIVFGNTDGYSGDAVLSDVTYEGTVNITETSETVTIPNTITLTGTAGTGLGTVNLSGDGSSLLLTGSQVLNNATINIGVSTGPDVYYVQAATLGSTPYIYSGSLLTFGPSLTIHQTGELATLQGAAEATDSLVNRGVINASFAGGSMTVTGNTFSNQHIINVSNGDDLHIEAYSFQNLGTLNVNGGIVDLGINGDWINTGLISDGAGGTVVLRGDVTLPELMSITRAGGAIVISGLLDNTGKTLSVGGTTALGTLLLTGVIQNGVVNDAGGGLQFNGGTLDNVIYQGVLDLSPADSKLTILDGLTVETVGGALPGAINLIGAGSTLTLQGDQTLNNATITMGAAGGTSALDVASNEVNYTEVPANVTLGAAVTIRQVGSVALDTSFNADTLTNQGIINAGVSGGQFAIGDEESTFNNSGTITVSNGDSLSIAAETFNNTGPVNVTTGATLAIGQPFGEGSTFTNAPGKISETGATIILNDSISLANLNSITRSGGTLAIGSGATADLGGGTLDVGGTFALGSIELMGTLQDGTVRDADIGLVMKFGSLQNIAYDGTMDLSPADSNVTDVSGVTFAGLSGTGSAVVKLEGSSSTLDVEGTQTLNNVIIDIGNSSFFASTLASTAAENSDYELLAPANLTLGSTAKINDVGSNGSITATANYEVGGGTITNAGIINALFLGGSLTIGGTSFINQGTVTVGNSDDLVIQTGSFVNTGTVTIITGGILDIGMQQGSPTETPFNSTGVLNENGGTINMNGTVAFANYAQITRTGGVVSMNGSSDLAGNTLNVGGTSALGALVVGGVISGGTIHDADQGLVMNGGTLLNVTDHGTLDMTNGGAMGTLAGAIVLAGLSGTGLFTMLLEGSGALLEVAATSLSNTNLQIGSANSDATLLTTAGSAGVAAAVTLASNFTINHAAGGATLTGDIVDNGSITASVNGGTFTIDGLSFTNNSVINVDSFDTMTIMPTNFVNKGTVNIASGGIVNLGAAFAVGAAGGTWSGGGPINLSAGTLNIFGAPTLADLNTVKHTGGNLDFFGVTNLGTNTLDVGAGTPLALVLDGGTFSNGTIHDNGNGMEYIAAGNGALLGLLGGTAKFTNITYQGLLDLSETGAILTVNNLTVTNAAGTGNGVVALTGAVTVLNFAGTQTFDNNTIDIGNENAVGSTLVQTDTTGLGATLTLGSHELIEQTGGHAHIIGARTFGSEIVNNGTIFAQQPGGEMYITIGTFINNNAIAAVNGDNVIFDPDTGINNGAFAIDATSTLRIDGPLSGTGTINFTSTSGGTLMLSSPTAEANAIVGFGSGGVGLSNTIDLLHLPATGLSYNTATNTLTVTNASTTIASLKFIGSYTSGNFTAVSDGDGGTNIIDPPSPIVSAAVPGSPSPSFIQPAASVDASAGNETLLLPAAGQPEETITGFAFGNGDLLDLRQALASSAWNGDLTNLAGFVTASAGSGGTTLNVDPTGQGGGSAVAFLSGVNTTLAALEAHNAFVSS